MILLTGFYLDPDPTRQAEFLECLQRNVRCEQIEQIHLFIEESLTPEALRQLHPMLSNEKICLVPHRRRLTYQALLAYANKRLINRCVIIANADISFDNTLAYLNGFNLVGRLLCLSRWDMQPDGSAVFFEHPASQDAWIFHSPIRTFACDFPLGVPGCDNRLAWEADNAGLLLSNPSRTVRAQHLHLTQVRRYTPQQRLSGPVLDVPTEHLTIRNERNQMNQEIIYALTSLPTQPESASRIRACIRSWINAGLQVRAFNHPSEIPILTQMYEIEVVPVEETSLESFGKHYIPINAMLDWAASQAAPVMIINADIDLQLANWEIKRLRYLSEGGLCFFVRYNMDAPSRSSARKPVLSREPHGIDAFLFHGKDAPAFPKSMLSMGQPF